MSRQKDLAGRRGGKVHRRAPGHGARGYPMLAQAERDQPENLNEILVSSSRSLIRCPAERARQADRVEHALLMRKLSIAGAVGKD